MSRFTFFLIAVLFAACQAREEVIPSTALKPFEEYYLLRNFPNLEGGAEGFLQAKALTRAMASQRNDAPYGFDASFVNRGPDNIGGRVNTLIRHPEDSNMIFSGLTAGGIFKSIDGGASWYPVFDDQITLSISFIRIDPKNPAVIYAGTGDPNISSYVFLGQGLYRSTDYGESWANVGLQDAGILSDLVIHPDHPDTLYVASMGIPMRRGVERGLYRSYDGGQNWDKVLYLSDEAGITDILINPDNPNILFACGWHRVRNQAESIVNGNLARVYRSLDGGDTWTKLDNGLPDEPLSRSGLAWSQGRVFVLFVGTNQNLKGVYSSTDNGTSWQEIPTDQDLNGLPSNALGGFGWYFGKMAVNPHDAEDIFILAVDLWRTIDGGNNWFRSTPEWWVYNVHADKHDLTFHPNGRVDLATDGGAYTSWDGGNSWEDLDEFPASQFYRIALNPHDPDQLSGGLQDNGTVRGWNAPASWERVYGGDGFQPAYHPVLADVFYAEWQGGSMVVTTDGGDNWDDFTNGIDPNDRVGWDAPYFISVHPPYPMYHGTNRIYRNMDHFNANWISISGKLTDTVEQFYPGTHVITALGESPLVPGTVLAGTGDGHLWITQDDGQSWNDVTTGLPERYVTSCQGSTEELNRIFVSHSGYRYNEFISHFHRSDDAGKTWIDISGDLPPLGVNTFVVIPETGDSIILVGTDAGIYGTVDGGEQWFPFGSGMPAIPVYDMKYQPITQTLVIGTHARSMYTVSLKELLEPVNTAIQLPKNGLQAWRIQGNPASSNIHLVSTGTFPSGTILLSLVDPVGKSILNQMLQGDVKSGQKIDIDLPTVQTGLYYLSIQQGEKRQVLPVIIDQS
ncbi:MAG: hypothetical protein K9I85_02835 [Saprospiraceae bacterium]|nr:hypothetical protein [Saprospiraceae bacterium]